MTFIIRPNRKETENKTVRFPLQLVEKIEQAIKGKDVTFSGFVIQACEYALNHLEQDPKK
ncbi:YlcI/YnfO family protein [Lactobacillus helsingborgensis]|nr:YlcI/YnfO family protein [Lactobacillus helsingborgensis]WLT00788.1 YlcI/YnfO family protein [Lactobacillus helsingborgensis]